jgi:dynein heavy chain 2
MEALTNDNMSTVVMMSTLGASPLQSLQLNVRQLYAPMLLQDPTWASKLDADARRSLEALDTALDAAMQLGEKQGAEEDVSTIVTPHDECQHWKMIDAGYMAGATSEQRARARQFWEVLQPYAEPLSNFGDLPLAEMAKLLRELRDVLDALYQAGYKETRMRHLLRILGSALDAYLNRRLSDLALLEAPYRAVARALRDASQLVDTWVADTQQLTGVFWPQLGTWRSGAFVDEVLGWLRTRLDELLEMRAVVHQLSAVLSPSELAELKVAKVFAPFAGLQPMHHSLFAQPAWQAAAATFKESMMPIESVVAWRSPRGSARRASRATRCCASSRGTRSSCGASSSSRSSRPRARRCSRSSSSSSSRSARTLRRARARPPARTARRAPSWARTCPRWSST